MTKTEAVIELLIDFLVNKSDFMWWNAFDDQAWSVEATREFAEKVAHTMRMRGIIDD